MWIRSQDGRCLRNVKDVQIETLIEVRINGIKKEIDSGIIKCDGEIFGEYKTEERALEVLDEIQKNIMDSNVTQHEYYNSQDGLKLDYTYKLKTIYEMPRSKKMINADKYLKSLNYKLFREDDNVIVYENKKDFAYIEIYKKTGLHRIYEQREIPFYENTERKVIGVSIEELKGIIMKIREMGFDL